MRWSILLAVATACGSGDEPTVVIEGGPVVLLTEGAELTAGVTIADAPTDGDCAPPFEPADFTVEVDAAAQAFFDVLAIEGAQGSVHLAIEPRCDAIAFGAGDSLVSLTVSAATGCAAPAEVRLQISDTIGAVCAPQVAAWLGDCSAAPADATTTVAIASEPAPGPLCVRIASRDPATESLMVDADSSVPQELIDAADVPSATTPFVGERIFTVPLGDSTHIRGSFALSYDIYEGEDMASAVLVNAGAIDLVVGEPGVSISAPFIGTPGFSADEFAATSMPVRVFRLKDDSGAPSGQLCANAARVTPGDFNVRTKPFSSLTDLDSGQSAGPGGWVCGSDFRLTVSPPIDAPPEEMVEIRASTCSGCGTDMPEPSPPNTVLATREVTFGVTSLADSVVCNGGDVTDTDLVVACADIYDDATPELVFRSANGSNDRACVYSGKGSRLAAATWGGASGSVVPEWLSAIRWYEPNASEPKNMILAQLPASGGLRVLEMTDTTPAVATWEPAVELGLDNVDVPLRAATTLARVGVTGATHIAYPVSGTDVLIRCITVGDLDIGSCVDTLVPNVALGGHTIDHLGRADLDGDGDGDLVAFTIDGSSPGVLELRAVVLEWTSAGQVVNQLANPVTIPSGDVYTGNHFRSGAVDRPNCMMDPCRQALYAVVSDPLEDVARLIRIRLNGMSTFDVDTVPSLNAAFDATSFQNRLIVSMQYGVAEVRATNTFFVDWIPRDPVLQEFVLAGTPVTPLPGYGLSVAVCRADVGSIAYTTSASSATVTGLSIDVALP